MHPENNEVRQLEYYGSYGVIAGRMADYNYRRLALLPWRELGRVMVHVITVRVVSRDLPELLHLLEELRR